MRKTKIVCTLGPASNEETIIEQLILAGMDAARFNFSHGTHETHLAQLTRFKHVRDSLGRPVATILDTKGPEIRIRTFGCGTITLKEGQTFVLSTEEVEGTQERVSVTYENLHKELQPGCHILIDDGLIELEVMSIQGRELNCTVLSGGELSSNKSINIPGVSIALPALTEKDKEDLRFGVENDFDFIAASFVRRASDVEEIRKVLAEYGGNDIGIIAKIENREGVDNLDAIIEAADGIMVARGDLGVEIPAHEVPVLQKRMIKAAVRAGKHVITATQMLDSMIRNPRPTRAEVTDVANAVYDGTDVVMLSGETANGKYPVEALKMMVHIVEETESHLDDSFYKRRRVSDDNSHSISNAVCYSSVSTARALGAKVIIAPSISGYTARMLSKWHPATMVAGMSPSIDTVRRMQLYWGVHPFQAKRAESTDTLIMNSIDALKAEGLVKEGDLAVVTAGVVSHSRRHEPATSTNIMRVVTVD